jgi:hypothetical protein
LRTVEKTTLVIALVLVSLCVVSFAILTFTDFWVAPIKSTSAVSAAARELVPLDARFPFKPPEGQGVPPERLEPYLAVSCRTKASADRMVAYIEGEHGPSRMFGQLVYTEESGKLMIAYLKDLAAALPEAQMGPEEFHWINLRLRLIRKGQPSEHKREGMRREIEELQKASENPQLDESTRKDLKRQIEFLESLPEAWGPAAQADWALYQANAERIKACRNDGRVVSAMHQLLASALGDKSRTAVEINPEEAPPPADTPLPQPAPKK